MIGGLYNSFGRYDHPRGLSWKSVNPSIPEDSSLAHNSVKMGLAVQNSKPPIFLHPADGSAYRHPCTGYRCNTIAYPHITQRSQTRPGTEWHSHSPIGNCGTLTLGNLPTKNGRLRMPPAHCSLRVLATPTLSPSTRIDNPPVQ